MGRHNNQLPDNLPQLQNLIKRDPPSYRDEFLQQLLHFKNTLEIFKLAPQQPNKTLDDLTMFLAQVSLCYPNELTGYANELIGLLETFNTVLDNTVRMNFCRALILLRNKNVVAPLELLQLFFRLLRSDDKALRVFLKDHIVTDVKNLNAKTKNAKVNGPLQGFMYTMMNDSSARAAKMSLDIMCELYKKNVWNDVKTVNVIASGCFSKITKVMVASIKFFLGKDANDNNSDDSDDDADVDPKTVLMANKFNKKTRKREKQLTKVKREAAKAKKKKSKAPVFNFSALNLVHDPQGMAEKLFRQLETTTKRFEVKLITLDVVSRLIGLHDLPLFNFYPYLQRFLQPHQRQVTRILQFAAQASHSLVPPDVMGPLLKTVADNFVTERNSSDVMAIGLNATREICARCPLAMGEDLLADLAMYKSYRDRSVMMAARSLVGLFRTKRPDVLHKKDRGRPSDATRDLPPTVEYGQVVPDDCVRGAEALLDSVEVDDAKASAQRVTLDGLLTDADFKTIETANLAKLVRYTTNKATKRKAADDLNLVADEPGELVKLADIENIFKRRKHGKEERVESVRRGQEDREKYGYKDRRANEFCSKTNREKRKTKAYQMVRHKARGKTKRSFKDKQTALRNYLIKQKRMK